MLEAKKLSVNKRVTLRQDLEVKSEGEVRVKERKKKKDQEEKLQDCFSCTSICLLFCLMVKKASVVS